jgi:hypothetical protein
MVGCKSRSGGGCGTGGGSGGGGTGGVVVGGFEPTSAEEYYAMRTGSALGVQHLQMQDPNFAALEEFSMSIGAGFGAGGGMGMMSQMQMNMNSNNNNNNNNNNINLGGASSPPQSPTMNSVTSGGGGGGSLRRRRESNISNGSSSAGAGIGNVNVVSGRSKRGANVNHRLSFGSSHSGGTNNGYGGGGSSNFFQTGPFSNASSASSSAEGSRRGSFGVSGAAMVVAAGSSGSTISPFHGMNDMGSGGASSNDLLLSLTAQRQKTLSKLDLSGISATEIAQEIEPQGFLSDRHLLQLYKSAALEKEFRPLFVPLPCGFQSKKFVSVDRRNRGVFLQGHQTPLSVTYCLMEPLSTSSLSLTAGLISSMVQPTVAAASSSSSAAAAAAASGSSKVFVWTVIPQSNVSKIGIGVSADGAGSGAASSSSSWEVLDSGSSALSSLLGLGLSSPSSHPQHNASASAPDFDDVLPPPHSHSNYEDQADDVEYVNPNATPRLSNTGVGGSRRGSVFPKSELPPTPGSTKLIPPPSPSSTTASTPSSSYLSPAASSSSGAAQPHSKFIGEDGGWSLWSDGSLRVGRIFVGRLPNGVTFSRGTEVKVKVDLEHRTMGFEVNGVDCGIAFRNLPGVLYPSVVLADGASVALLLNGGSGGGDRSGHGQVGGIRGGMRR